MMTRIFLSTILIFTLASCQNSQRNNQPQSPTPQALEDKSSFAIVSKSRYSENLMESLYAEIVSNDIALKRLEKSIADLNSSKQDSIDSFYKFDNKMQGYRNVVQLTVTQIQDTILRNRMKLLVDTHVAKYDSLIAKHKHLLNDINKNDSTLDDLHLALKIVTTLPVIEKYQRDNLPQTTPLEGFLNQQHKTIQLADSLVNK
ncbi:hypothetical protein [Chitinophaga jiangningensis]|nr:hypothetical protein [Chitinophaga jiangningensis]